jgi:2-keto-4-pentenoate hydratase
VTSTTTPTAVEQAVDRLSRAAASRQPCPPVRDLIDRDDVVGAYAVQERITALNLAAGRRIVGRKIGLTSSAVQAQLGVDRPDFGVLFDDMAFASGATLPMDRLIQPKVEAEVAFVLGRDLAEQDIDDAAVRRSIEYAVAALEIVDCRISNWDITFADTVADNASSGLFVLGADRRTLDDFEPAAVAMTMSVNGQERSTGTGRDCLGDPLEALRWLATTARDLGEPLRAGQVILSGALGPMAVVDAGSEVTATLSGLGEVTARFADVATRGAEAIS